MRRRVPMLLGALGVFIASGAAAQTSANVTASITIGQVLFISVNTNTVGFNTPAAADFTAGTIAANNSTDVTYGGNVVHDVQIQTAVTNMTALSGNPANIKAATDLQWSPDGTTWAGVSTTSALIVDDAPVGTATTNIQYRMLIDIATDFPDTHTLDFTYTVVPG